MCLASRRRTPSSTGTLIQIRFSQGRWERSFTPFFLRALVPCDDPSNAINSLHKNRTITQSPGSLGVNTKIPLPLFNPPRICRVRGITTETTSSAALCKPFAPRKHSPRAAAGSREGLVALHRTYQCHGIPCVTLAEPESGQSNANYPRTLARRADPCSSPNPRNLYRKPGRP